MSKSKNEIKNSSEGIKLIGRLLAAPLESTLSIFDMPNFPILMSYLDFNSRSTLSLRIIESLITSHSSNSSKEYLNSTEKITILLDFIKPLLSDIQDSIESDVYQFEYEQNTVSKLIFIISNTDPYKYLEMLGLFRAVFMKGGQKRQKFTLPALINAYLSFASCISLAYSTLSSNNKPIHDQFVEKIDTSIIKNDSDVSKLIQKIHTSINEIIGTTAQEYPEIAFKLCLSCITQLNYMKTDRSVFEEVCYNYSSYCLELFQEGKIEADKKLNLIILFIATLSNITIMSTDNLSAITINIQQISQTLVKRSDQCIAMLNCSHLFFNDVISDQAKVQECLTKSKRFAEFAMTNAQNLNLFVLLLNKYLYYIEKGATFIKPDIINDIIEVVKNHILTIITENTNATFLPEIEKYFDATVEVINIRKKSGSSKIIEEIVL